MTDSEINLAIARIEYPNKGVSIISTERAVHVEGLGLKNYCSNWADIGPIIERERIGLAPLHDRQYRAYCSSGVFAIDKSPTKAAALCYLKTKGVEI